MWRQLYFYSPSQKKLIFLKLEMNGEENNPPKLAKPEGLDMRRLGLSNAMNSLLILLTSKKGDDL